VDDTPESGKGTGMKKARREATRKANAIGGGPSDTDERPTRKNYYLRQSKIDLAKEILGARTETEAVEGALDLLIYGEALAAGTEEMAGEEYRDVLGLLRELPASARKK
jgi:hypothetical protein